jgi:hypothetical protein
VGSGRGGWLRGRRSPCFHIWRWGVLYLGGYLRSASYSVFSLDLSIFGGGLIRCVSAGGARGAQRVSVNGYALKWFICHSLGVMGGSWGVTIL